MIPAPAARLRLKPRPRSASRRGAIIVLAAILIIALLAMVAFGVDCGYVVLTRTELQAATDSAALAGAGALVNGTGAARVQAVSYLGKNRVGGRSLGAANAAIEFGAWDPARRSFTVNAASPSAVRVTATNTAQPLFFGRVLGKNTFHTQTQAVATYQPRDISLVLDYSSSMCYDSQFRNIHLLGKPAIEANLRQIYAELGSPSYGSLALTPVSYGGSGTSNSSVKSRFGLSTVPYPYPGGAWDQYIDYVQTDGTIASAGYQNQYGYLTWVHYLLARQNGASRTPVLWQVSAQPVTALKDAVDVFLSYLGKHSTEDQVNFSLYTYADRTAILESSLTKDYARIARLCRQRQAGHYLGTTNISAGMNKGRVDLEKNGRAGALKMMVLMTDGVVNMPTGNTTTDKNLVLQEAQACAKAQIPVVTIALGAYADVPLMQRVADITSGAAFVVPGGQPISQVEKQLEDVFRQVASDRPLKLVQ